MPDLKETLQREHELNISQIFLSYKKENISATIKQALKQDFKELIDNELFRKNLLDLLSFILTTHESRNMREIRDKQASVRTSTKDFLDETSFKKIKELYERSYRPIP